MMKYVRFFLLSVWYSLGSLVLCGLLVSLFYILFRRLTGRSGRAFLLATSLIGTPVHETGHALMCLLFGHRITAISFFRPCAKDGTLGYVTHTYRPGNPYQQLGNLFIGMGPVFSGLSVILLLLALTFPASSEKYIGMVSSVSWEGMDGLSFLTGGIGLIGSMIRETGSGTVPLWGQILSFVLILSVSLHIHLSVEDIKGASGAIPLYLILIALLTVITGLIGEGAMETVLRALRQFSFMTAWLFVPVLAASLLQVAVAWPVWVIRHLFR